MLVFIVAFLVAETIIIVLIMLAFSLSAGLVCILWGNLFISFAHIFIGLFVLTELRVQLFVDINPY